MNSPDPGKRGLTNGQLCIMRASYLQNSFVEPMFALTRLRRGTIIAVYLDPRVVCGWVVFMNGIFRIVFLVSFILFAGLLRAQGPCSNEDMRGDFATQPTGILTLGPFAGPFAATGIIHFDGTGRFTGVATSSFHGSVIFPFNADGTYDVTPDCVLSIFEETLRIGFEGVISRTKDEVPLFQPQDTTITTNVLRRLKISSCRDADLRDSWVIQASGSNIITSGSFAQIGTLRFDGAGNVAGKTGTSKNGVIVPRTVSGTYRVHEDCTFSVRLTDETGALSHFYGTFFDDGSRFIFIYSDDGVVIRGVAEQTASQSNCSSADLQGDFSTQPIGILSFGPFAGPFSAGGVVHFDGVGRFSGFATSSFNGTIFPFDAFGTYSVTADCFISTFEETLQIPFEGYVSKSKNEVYLFQPQEGAITTNTLHRLDLSSCRNSDLRDSWVFQASGTNVAAGARAVQLGRLRFDGEGNVTGTAGSVVNGAYSRSYAVSGTYSVQKGCTLTLSLTDENGVPSHIFGAFYADGSEFAFIYTDDGTVIPGTAKQAAGN